MAWDSSKKRPIKKQVTTNFFTFIKKVHPRKTFKVFFCLPSTQANDVKEALKLGIINNKTKIIAVEKDKKYLPELRNALDNLGFGENSRVVINKKLCDITTWHLTEACKTLGVKGIDLFYIDTCNCLVACLQSWIEDVVGSVKTNDAVIVTNVLAARATWDLEKYPTNKDCLGSKVTHNPWATNIAWCLWEKTGLPTMYTVGYKEKNISTPMVLCVNTKINNSEKFFQKKWEKLIHLGIYATNLGYN